MDVYQVRLYLPQGEVVGVFTPDENEARDWAAEYGHYPVWTVTENDGQGRSLKYIAKPPAGA